MFGRRMDLDSTQASPIGPDDVPAGLDRAAFAAGCFWGVRRPVCASHRHRGDPGLDLLPAEVYHQRYTERTGHGGCHVANW